MESAKQFAEEEWLKIITKHEYAFSDMIDFPSFHQDILNALVDAYNQGVCDSQQNSK